MGEIKPFFYDGELSSSKSLLNRALILQSFFPDLIIKGQSSCQDVVKMRAAVNNLLHGTSNHFDCGAAGTTFRFLLPRLAREQGEFFIEGSDRLFERPHQPLYKVLKSLGAKVYLEEKNCLRLVSDGWAFDQPLMMDLEISSQPMSGVLLSAWNLPRPLEIGRGDYEGSQSYLDMTLDFLTQVGMKLEVSEKKIVVPARQTLRVSQVSIDPDMSSAFTLACFALVNGDLTLNEFPAFSRQPDFYFLKILETLAADLKHDKIKCRLQVRTSPDLRPIDVNLRNNPDLFPVLSILLSRVEGTSILSGLDSLAHKESNRLENTINLLGNLGISCTYQNRKLYIQGKRNHQYPRPFVFDPDQDHRMAMAAALARHQGASIDILTPEVVDKSFPEFWKIVGL